MHFYQDSKSLKLEVARIFSIVLHSNKVEGKIKLQLRIQILNVRFYSLKWLEKVLTAA